MWVYADSTAGHGDSSANLNASSTWAVTSASIPANVAAVMPALLDALLTLLSRRGTKTFAEVAAPTLKILDQGAKPFHKDLAVTMRRLIEAEKGAPHDRIRGLRLVADYFYRGPLAREIDDWMRQNGGLIRRQNCPPRRENCLGHSRHGRLPAQTSAAAVR